MAVRGVDGIDRLNVQLIPGRGCSQGRWYRSPQRPTDFWPWLFAVSMLSLASMFKLVVLLVNFFLSCLLLRSHGDSPCCCVLLATAVAWLTVLEVDVAERLCMLCNHCSTESRGVQVRDIVLARRTVDLFDLSSTCNYNCATPMCLMRSMPGLCIRGHSSPTRCPSILMLRVLLRTSLLLHCCCR